MWYIIKFLLKLILGNIVHISLGIVLIINIIFLFNIKIFNKYGKFLNTIYYRNEKDSNGDELTGDRKVAEGCTFEDWVFDFTNRYHLEGYRSICEHQVI